MSEFAAGEIYYADVPFDGETGSKIRPILVMSDETVCVLSYKMTSHMPRDEYDYLLKEWKASGLKRETTVRLNKQYSLSPARIYQKIGEIQLYDWERIKTKSTRNESEKSE